MSSERLHIQIWYHTRIYQSVVLTHEQAPLWTDTVYKTKLGSDHKGLVWTK